jgi:hypothetical protein
MFASSRLGKVVLFRRDNRFLIAPHHHRVFLSLDLRLRIRHRSSDGYVRLTLDRYNRDLLIILLLSLLLFDNHIFMNQPVLARNSNAHLLEPTPFRRRSFRTPNLLEPTTHARFLVRALDVYAPHLRPRFRFARLCVVGGRELLQISKALTVVVVVGTEVAFIFELAWVAFVAYFTVEEADGGGEGVVSLRYR